MRNSNDRITVLITGCSSGLGLEMAREIAKSDRYRAVLTARSTSIGKLRAEIPESENLLIRPLDVTNAKQMRMAIEEMSHCFGRIDVLINNAGICYRGVVEHMDESSELEQIHTNYLGPMALIRLVLPIMREQKSGRIINVSSVSGMMPMPTMGSYSASKHALEAATEALWYEARPFGISVHYVQPGFIRSKSYLNTKLSNKASVSELLRGPHSEYYQDIRPFIARMMNKSKAGPNQVAQRILHLAEYGQRSLRVSVTFDAVLFAIFRKILPLYFFNLIMYMMLPGSGAWGRVERKLVRTSAQGIGLGLDERIKV